MVKTYIYASLSKFASRAATLQIVFNFYLKINILHSCRNPAIPMCFCVSTATGGQKAHCYALNLVALQFLAAHNMLQARHLRIIPHGFLTISAQFIRRLRSVPIHTLWMSQSVQMFLLPRLRALPARYIPRLSVASLPGVLGRTRNVVVLASILPDARGSEWIVCHCVNKT